MNKKSRELLKNTIIIFISKACTQLISFLLLPLYTSILSSEEYGQIDLIITYSALAMPLIGLQLEMGLFRYLIDNRNNEKKKSILITNTIITIFISIAIFSIIYTLIANFINLPYRYLILANILVTILSSYCLQLSRGLGDNIGYALGSIITGLTTIITNLILLLLFDGGIYGILASSIIAHFVGILFIGIREKIYKYIKLKQYKKAEVAVILKYSAPLIPNSLIWWVINVSDRTIISFFMNMGANGIYAVSNKFSNIIIQIYNIFNLSWTESASLHINDDDRDKFFSDTFNTTIKTFTTISLTMLAFMPILFKIMVGDGYSEAYQYIPILSIGMIFNIIVSFIGAIYIAKKKTKDVAITSFWSGILNIAINVILIKTIGVWAAALSTLLAFLIMSVYRYFDIQKYIKLKLNKRLTLMLLLLTSVCIILYYVNNTITIVANIIIVSTTSVWLNSGIIKTIARKIKIKYLG